MSIPDTGSSMQHSNSFVVIGCKRAETEYPGSLAVFEVSQGYWTLLFLSVNGSNSLIYCGLLPRLPIIKETEIRDNHVTPSQ